MPHIADHSMQLYSSTTSPFARKANMVVKLTHLDAQVDVVYTNPFEDDSLRKINPLGKVPALKTEQQLLTDSHLICEYLDDIAATRNLYHKGQEDYYQVQQLHMLCNGVLEAAVATVMEQRRDTEHSSYWLGRWSASIDAALAGVDVAQLGTPEQPHIGTVAMVAALGYLDFRHAQRNWRAQFPTIAQWYTGFEELDWVVSTVPRV